eukprot:1373581-Pyramimonas_sp.AAC.1
MGPRSAVLGGPIRRSTEGSRDGGRVRQRRPGRGPHRRPQWHRLHASKPSRAAFRGPIRHSTEDSSGTGRM